MNKRQRKKKRLALSWGPPDGRATVWTRQNWGSTLRALCWHCTKAVAKGERRSVDLRKMCRCETPTLRKGLGG